MIKTCLQHTKCTNKVTFGMKVHWENSAQMVMLSCCYDNTQQLGRALSREALFFPVSMTQLLPSRRMISWSLPLMLSVRWFELWPITKTRAPEKQNTMILEQRAVAFWISHHLDGRTKAFSILLKKGKKLRSGRC